MKDKSVSGMALCIATGLAIGGAFFGAMALPMALA